jgi:hypothetical protein
MLALQMSVWFSARSIVEFKSSQSNRDTPYIFIATLFAPTHPLSHSIAEVSSAPSLVLPPIVPFSPWLLLWPPVCTRQAVALASSPETFDLVSLS